jgi:DNA polymerase III alpha subunit
VNYTKLKLDELGRPMYTSENILEMLRRGQDKLLSNIEVDPTDQDIIKYNSVAQQEGLDPFKIYTPSLLSQKEFDYKCQNTWLMPDEYQNFNIEEWLLLQVTTDEEIQRVNEELIAFTKHNMIGLLKWLKYFVDTCRQKNIVWGCGRGSSVASFVLYLISVHKVNPLLYNLDWKEFLR